MRTCFVVAASCLLGGAAFAAKAAPAYKTVEGKGYCKFRSRSNWKVEEDWKGSEPKASLTAGKTQVSISVTFFRDGDVRYPSLDAYRTQIERPNVQLKKTVGAETATSLDGRAAVAVHMELLDPLWGAIRVGLQPKVFKDVVLGAYPGGFYALGFSASQAKYAAARPEFEHFLASFKLEVPKPAPPSAK